MTRFKLLFIERYRGGYRFRRRVPADVQEKVGKKSWVHTFPPRIPLAVIEREGKRFALLYDRKITTTRGQEVSPAQIEQAEKFARELLAGDPLDKYGYLELAAQGEMSGLTMAVVSALEHGGRYVPDSLSLTAAWERDKRLYGGERDEKPIQYAIEAFIKAHGDGPITLISRGDVSEWLVAQAKGGLAPSTVLRRLGALRALVGRTYLDLDHPGRNPFERHQVKGGAGRASDRLPFDRRMLALIDRYLTTSPRLSHETRNIMQIMKGTGGGPGEVGGLVLSDVSLGGAIPFVWIRANAQRRIKVPARDRRIPLVGAALTSAQDAHKRATVRTKGSRKSPDKTPLFSSFGISGRGADSISAKLNKAIRTAGVPKSPRLTAYSFRHCLSEALRSAGTPDHVQRRILGHADRGVPDRYGSPRVRLAKARDALVAAMEYLGDVDPSIYSEAERL